MSIAVDVLAPSPSEAHDIAPAGQGRFREAFWVAGVSVFSLGVALLLYQVWNANPHLPLGYSYDMRGMTALIKGMDHNGWWMHNPQLGAPFVQDLRDFPVSGQTSQLVVIRAIVAVVHSPGLTINLYFFGGFALLAAVSFLVFRRFALSRPIAAALAVGYDFLPFHLWHGPDHLTHSAYFVAPLGVLLIVRVLEPDLRLLRDPSRAVRRPYFGPSGSLRLGPLAALLGIAIIIGSSDEMLSCFTVVLLVIGGLLAAFATRRASRLVLALVLAATIVGTFLLLTLPTILQVIAVGKNQVAGTRLVFESDLYGLRPALMLLPTPQHWINGLGSFARNVLHGNSAPSEGGQAIGTLGAIGVFAALGMLFLRALRPQSSRDTRVRGPLSPIAMPLAVVIVLGILLGAGGATFLDALSGFVQVRTWNWIVVLIAFAAFTLTGFGCERILGAIRARTTDRHLLQAATIALVLVVAGVGILDGGRPPRPDEKTITREWISDQAFVAAMHTVQPPDGMIFQFPVMAFPESWPIASMQDYEQLRGYVADKGEFRWSYGAMKGRPQGDWQSKLPAIPTAADLRALVGLGFTGIWVNRDGYNDRAQFFEAKLVPLLGHPTLISKNRRLSFYDLRPFARRIKPGTDLVAEARARFGVTAPKSN